MLAGLSLPVKGSYTCKLTMLRIIRLYYILVNAVDCTFQTISLLLELWFALEWPFFIPKILHLGLCFGMLAQFEAYVLIEN